MKSSAKLLKAAEIIEKSGWCRGAYKSEEGSFCVLGSIREANRLYYGFDAYGNEVSYLIGAYPFKKLSPSNANMIITEINDTVVQNADDALLWLRTAAKAALDMND